MASYSAKQRMLNLLVALDVFLFSLCCLGGTKRNETASSAAWSLERDGRWQGKLFRPLIDWLFSRIQPYHCANAWRNEQPTQGSTMETFIQPKITGYRQLDQAEATLMNRAKAIDAATQMLVADIRAHIQAQWLTARPTVGEDLDVAERLGNAEPERWLAMGRTSIQLGVMQLVRSVAQPAT